MSDQRQLPKGKCRDCGHEANIPWSQWRDKRGVRCQKCGGMMDADRPILLRAKTVTASQKRVKEVRGNAGSHTRKR